MHLFYQKDEVVFLVIQEEVELHNIELTFAPSMIVIDCLSNCLS